MRKFLTVAAACGLALGVAACGKHDDAASSNLSAADNMLVPADENVADADAANMGAADNSTAAMTNDSSGGAAANAQ